MRALHGHEGVLPATPAQVDIAVDPLDGTTLVSQVRSADYSCVGAVRLPGSQHQLSVTGSPTWELFCSESTICSSQMMQLCHVPALRLGSSLLAACATGLRSPCTSFCRAGTAQSP